MTQDSNSRDRSPVPASLTASTPRPRSSRRKQYSLAWLEEPYNRTHGEMSLWIAVITQAMMDALSRAGNAEARYYKNEAIHWLTGNSKDFAMVCMCAGLDPDYVRRNAKRSLLKPVSWRAEAGKGDRYLERKSYRRRKSCEAYKSCEARSDCAGSRSPRSDDPVQPNGSQDFLQNKIIVLRSGVAARRI